MSKKREKNYRKRHVSAILWTLIQWDEPLMKHELITLAARHGRPTDAYLLGMIDGLFYGGFVTLYHSEDGRVTWVEITEAGRRLYDEVG